MGVAGIGESTEHLAQLREQRLSLVGGWVGAGQGVVLATPSAITDELHHQSRAVQLHRVWNRCAGRPQARQHRELG